MKSDIKLYQILERNGFSKEEAEEFIQYMNGSDSNAATKADLKEEIQSLEIRMMAQFLKLQESMNGQTNRFLAIVVTLGALMKLVDYLIHKSSI